MSVLVWVHDWSWWLVAAAVLFAGVIVYALWAGRHRPQHAQPRRLAVDLPVHAATVPFRPVVGVPPWQPPPLDWREVAHEPDWREQTHADLAPATLDSGLGASSSVTPGPDLAAPGFPGLSPVANRINEVDGGGFGELAAAATATVTPTDLADLPASLPEPGLVHTWAGRAVETSGEWLRRLERDAGPGWTYAGAAA